MPGAGLGDEMERGMSQILPVAVRSLDFIPGVLGSDMRDLVPQPVIEPSLLAV